MYQHRLAQKTGDFKLLKPRTEYQNVHCINFSSLRKSQLPPIQAIILSKIQFGLRNTRIKSRNGLPQIARTLKAIGEGIVSERQASKALNALQMAGLIQKRRGIWWGKSRLFISCATKHEEIKINHKKFGLVAKEMGGFLEALLWLRIFYAMQNTNIELSGKKYCVISSDRLSEFLGVSGRTCERMLCKMIADSKVEKTLASYGGRSRAHWTINEQVISQMSDLILAQPVENLEKSCLKNDCPQQICRLAKRQSCISLMKEKTKDKKYNNNICGNVGNLFGEKRDVILNKKNYVLGALERTLKRYPHIQLTNPKQTQNQVLCSILDPLQNPRGLSFKHLINRTLKLLSKGDYRVPIGYKHTIIGKQEVEACQEREMQWRLLKEAEISSSKKKSPIFNEVFRHKKNADEAQLNIKKAQEELNNLKFKFLGGELSRADYQYEAQGLIKALSFIGDETQKRGIL